VRVIAATEGQVFAYRDDALLVVVRGEHVSPFGPAFEPVRREISGKCISLGYQGENSGFKDGDPEWSRRGEVSIYKVWLECPPYEHDCAGVVSVAG
jgi:hypothetical protein